MKRYRFYILAPIVSLAIIISAAMFVLHEFLDDWDADARKGVYEIIASVPSPDDDLVATSYLHMGGGAAGWCYVFVNVRRKDEPFNLDKNSVFQSRCNGAPELRWKDEKSLSINYSPDATVYKRENNWGSRGGVNIFYSAR